MSDIDDRLRAEARAIGATADPGLPARICARLPATPPPAARPAAPWPLAAAAVLALAILAWLLAGRGGPAAAVPLAAQPDPPAAPALPSPPTLDELIAAARAPAPVASEVDALKSDLAAIAATLRGAVPF